MPSDKIESKFTLKQLYDFNYQLARELAPKFKECTTMEKIMFFQASYFCEQLEKCSDSEVKAICKQ